MPFVMAPVNTRVVRRSNALLGHAYGELQPAPLQVMLSSCLPYSSYLVHSLFQRAIIAMSLANLTPHARVRRHLIYLKYWTLNLRPLMVYPQVLFPPMGFMSQPQQTPKPHKWTPVHQCSLEAVRHALIGLLVHLDLKCSDSLVTSLS